MKIKSFAIGLLLAAVGAAHAQSPATSGAGTAPDQDARRKESEAESRRRTGEPSTITLYGLLDAGAEYVGNVGPSGGRLVRMPSLTGSLPSRLGFRGSEDLGDGLRAIFVLEAGIGVDTGTSLQGGRLFGRQALVGFSGRAGTLTFGRQYTMLFWSILDADILGPGIYGSASLDSYIANARADNAVAYRGTFGGLTLGGTYSLGRDAVNAGPSPAGTNCAGEGLPDTRACREWSAMAKYDSPVWGIALAIDKIRGGPGAFAGLTNSAMTDSRVSANGYVKVAGGQIAGGLIRRDNDASAQTPRSDLWYLGGSYPVAPLLILDAELFRLKFRNSANKANMGALRATYNLSKRTAIYATGGRIVNGGLSALSVSGGAAGSNPVAGASQNAAMVGVRHSF